MGRYRVSRMPGLQPIPAVPWWYPAGLLSALLRRSLFTGRLTALDLRSGTTSFVRR